MRRFSFGVVIGIAIWFAYSAAPSLYQWWISPPPLCSLAQEISDYLDSNDSEWGVNTSLGDLSTNKQIYGRWQTIIHIHFWRHNFDTEDQIKVMDNNVKDLISEKELHYLIKKAKAKYESVKRYQATVLRDKISKDLKDTGEKHD